MDSQDNVYVTDTYNNRVQKFTSSGVFITQWSISGYGWGVAVDSSGNVYVSDYSNNCIQKFSMQGPSNPAPSVAWSQTYSGSWLGGANSMIQTADGGYALVGRTDLSNVTVPGRSAWLIKTDSIGNQALEPNLPRKTHLHRSIFITNTSDGGYLIACGTSIDWQYLLCLRLLRLIQMAICCGIRHYGGIGYVYSDSALQTTDGGYALLGTTDDSQRLACQN